MVSKIHQILLLSMVPSYTYRCLIVLVRFCVYVHGTRLVPIRIPIDGPIFLPVVNDFRC